MTYEKTDGGGAEVVSVIAIVILVALALLAGMYVIPRLQQAETQPSGIEVNLPTTPAPSEPAE